MTVQVNLLIAMFSKTFDEIAGHSGNEHKFQLAMVISARQVCFAKPNALPNSILGPKPLPYPTRFFDFRQDRVQHGLGTMFGCRRIFLVVISRQARTGTGSAPANLTLVVRLLLDRVELDGEM